MKPARLLSPWKAGTPPPGMALVVTLSALVLLTVLVLAFFSRAQSNRQLSYSSTSLLGAKSIAHSALDIITGELRAEIADSTRSTLSGSNGVWLYKPINNTFLLPAQLGVSAASGPLVKVSAANTSIRPNGAIQGSAVSISSPSLKGQSISTARWFTSSASSPMLGSQATLPTWLFLTRGNGVKTPASVTVARDKTSNDYVIGRFAYTVYDIGQLLNVNVAGYPAVASGDAAYKSSVAYADLTALGLTSTNVSDLLSWRNAVTGTSADAFKEWALGVPASSGTLNPAALTTARAGHFSIVNGDNTFLSRRDLLNNPALSSAASLFTHFSRSTNATSYSPAIVTATNPNLADVRFPAAATITHYQDDGSAATYSVQPGDFLLQRRFSLGKLAWLTHTGPLAGISDAAIKACFGLSWDSAANAWTYVGDAAGAQSAIKTLAQVAAANREPNFFELLQAGIQSGSLGKSGDLGATSISGLSGVEANKAYQIIRIGANIVDQYDTDSYPTVISFNNFQFYGIEDLPYLNKILYKNIGTPIHPGANQCFPPFHIYLVYELWNPHQPSASTGRPTRFRVRIGNDASYQLKGYYALNPAVSEDITALAPLSGVGGDPLEFDADTTSNDSKSSYREPRVIRTGDASTLRTELNDATYGACNALRFPDITSTTLPSVGYISYSLSRGVFVLEYQEGTAWRPYATFTGHEEAGGVTGIGNSSTFSPALANTGSTGIKGIYFASKPDPRTFRFDAHDSYNFQDAADTSLHSSDSAYLYSHHYRPNFAPTSGTFYMSLVAANNSDFKDPSNTSYPYADNDSVTRPADAWYGVNPYALGNSAARPIILNRPFRSVGELGYVFRDMPWKTLDLFTDRSADGALLDLFSLCDEPPKSAGRVNLNTSQSKVQQSLFSGAEKISDAAALASSLSAYSGSNTFSNMAMLANFIYSSGTTSLSQIKTQREAPVRALASVSQTRTWNLLIDVVAQSGRYTASSSTLNDFLVEGETRYWLSVAIDRYTGKIIDQQLENANEH